MKLMSLYKEEVKRFLLKHPTFNFKITIPLTPEFLKQAEKRIRMGAKTYGDDWKRKDCLKERDFEVFDCFNYTILDACQREYKKSRKSKKS